MREIQTVTPAEATPARAQPLPSSSSSSWMLTRGQRRSQENRPAETRGGPANGPRRRCHLCCTRIAVFCVARSMKESEAFYLLQSGDRLHKPAFQLRGFFFAKGLSFGRFVQVQLRCSTHSCARQRGGIRVTKPKPNQMNKRWSGQSTALTRCEHAGRLPARSRPRPVICRRMTLDWTLRTRPLWSIAAAPIGVGDCDDVEFILHRHL